VTTADAPGPGVVSAIEAAMRSTAAVHGSAPG
jgi:hypothetical protein